MTDSVFITNTELSVSETAGTVLESISRSGTLAGPVTVKYGITSDTATAGQDFVGGQGTVTIPAGVSRVTVPIKIINDTLPEPTETFVFSLIDSPDSTATIGVPRTSRVSILDDETPAPPPNPEPPLISNYNVTSTPVISGLDQPIRVVFSPVDPSKVYVAEKPGVIALSDLNTGTTRTVIDLSRQVNDAGDRGLLDIALDPHFAQNGFIYVFEVIDPPDAVRQTGNAGPDGTGNRYAQVIRYTADPATSFSTILSNSAKILLGNAGQSEADISGGGAQDFTDPAFAGAVSSEQFINPKAATPPTVVNGFKQDYLKVDSSSHAGGHLNFGPDGNLYVSVGEGSSFDYADPHSLNVQSLDSLSGKILRIDPATGLGLADNPFVTSGIILDSNRAKVYQLGLRNPFSVAFAPDGRLFIADTGWNSWEEIDSAGPGANFGWPFYEGGDGGVSIKTPAYSDMAAAQAFYAKVANGTAFVTAPIRAFAHDSSLPGFQNQAITAGEVIYTGTVYPASLKNNFFFTNFPDGQVFAVDINNSANVKYLYSVSGDAPVDFVQGPDGSVYYADLLNGVIGRLGITDATKPVKLTVGSGPDTLVLKISQDAFQGSAQYTVSVDGKQIGGTLTAGASHAAGLDDTVAVLGNFAAGPHTLTVNFLNDLFQGTPDTDRNLYVDGVTYDGGAVPNSTSALLSAGPQNLAFTDNGTSFPPISTTFGSGPDSLILKISQDVFQGSAQYTVSVDGKQIGGVLTASALHASGQHDTVTVHGTFAAGPHTLTVNFLEDAFGGTATTDRNLYVDSVTINGTGVPGGSKTLLSAGSQTINFTEVPVITIDPADTDPVVNDSHVNIVATSGDHSLFIGGSFDTARLSGGTEGVLAFQGHNTIVTATGNDTIRTAGTGSVVNAGAGTNHIEDSGSGNRIIMPAVGGFDDVFGFVLQNSDTLDFRPALAKTAWDGSSATLGNFLKVTVVGGDATIALAPTAGGAFSNVAVLHASGGLDLPGLLTHALV
jgi:glucose/arabinose dehydrogenase